MYITKTRLNQLVDSYHRSGSVPGELVDVAGKIAGGIYDRFGGPEVEREEFVQECTFLIITKLYLLRTDMNVFSYLSQICRNKFRQLRKVVKREEIKIASYVKDRPDAIGEM